ncbi:MAG: hypothetical protein A2Z65_06460 [Gallionellales bacterium RIFCSPLOWO2_02_58_13]|nr:MAG: hypothetical protein A2Z65_06460 [Gallionellales bacterium RIFCSPLOWO2_02_58_13]
MKNLPPHLLSHLLQLPRQLRLLLRPLKLLLHRLLRLPPTPLPHRLPRSKPPASGKQKSRR